MLVDYHIHTPYCGHAKGQTIEYIEAALEAGVTEMCFADHLGRYYLTRSQRKRYWDWGMSTGDLARYYAELCELRELYASRITIRIGLEIDYVQGAEDLLAPLVEVYDFDFFLGSIHCLPSIGWSHLARYTDVDGPLIYRSYFQSARAALESGLFSSLAHLDFVWRYIPWPQSISQELLEEIARTVHCASSCGMSMEVNSNGFIHSLMHEYPDHPDPFEFYLDELARQQVPITLGSDAHIPKAVAAEFGEILPLLTSKGIRTLSTFERHRPSFHPLAQLSATSS